MKIETIRIINALIMVSAYVIEIISIIVWYKVPDIKKYIKKVKEKVKELKKNA